MTSSRSAVGERSRPPHTSRFGQGQLAHGSSFSDTACCTIAPPSRQVDGTCPSVIILRKTESSLSAALCEKYCCLIAHLQNAQFAPLQTASLTMPARERGLGSPVL